MEEPINLTHGAAGTGKLRSFFRFRPGKKNHNNNGKPNQERANRFFLPHGDNFLGAKKLVKSKSSSEYCPSPDILKMTEQQRQQVFQHSLHYLGKKLVQEEEEAFSRAQSTPEFWTASTPDTSLDPSDSYNCSASLADEHDDDEEEEKETPPYDHNRSRPRVRERPIRRTEDQEDTILEDDDDEEEDTDSVYTTRFWVKALSSCTAPQLECGAPPGVNVPTAEATRRQLGALARNIGIRKGRNSILKMDKVICVAADADHNYGVADMLGVAAQQPVGFYSCAAPSNHDGKQTPVPTEIMSSARASMPDKSVRELRVRDDDSTISTRLSVYLHD